LEVEDEKIGATDGMKNWKDGTVHKQNMHDSKV
jgi:hypothetical protein